MVALLEAKDLRLYYGTLRGTLRAVDGVSFNIGEQEALGVVGESGSGKTSLALAAMRLLPKNVVRFEGSIVLERVDLTCLSDEDFRRKVRWRKISMVFQGAMNSLNPVVKVGHQVAEPLLSDGPVNREAAFREARRTLEMAGLPAEVFDRYAHELSGGMKQRVAIAMALILKPRLVILDEPTSALDVSIQAQIMNLLKRLKREAGLSMMFITHDIALASDVCDRMAVMYGGEIIETGSAEQVLASPGHPYTQKLLASTPKLRGAGKPAFIRGAPPDLVYPPEGCRFHPRCPYAFERCTYESPPAFTIGDGHSARCWLHGDY